jgi:hypothetical protein
MQARASSSPGSLSLEKTKEILMRIPGNGCRPALNHNALTADRPRTAVTPRRGNTLISPERP